MLRKGLPVRGDPARLARRRSSAVRGSLLAAAPGAANSPPKAVGSGSRWVDFLPADIGRLDAAKREADRETLRMCLSSHFMLHSASEEQMDALVQTHATRCSISSSSSSSTQQQRQHLQQRRRLQRPQRAPYHSHHPLSYQLCRSSARGTQCACRASGSSPFTCAQEVASR